MSALRPLILIGLIITAGGFTSDIIGDYVGPIEYKGYLVFDYPEGENPINNIVFTIDPLLVDNLVIVNVPAPWTYNYQDGALMLSEGSLNPGGSVRVTVSINKYFEDGEYPISSVGTTTSGEVSNAFGSLLVGELYLLNVIALASVYRVPLAASVIGLGFIEIILSRMLKSKPKEGDSIVDDLQPYNFGAKERPKQTTAQAQDLKNLVESQEPLFADSLQYSDDKNFILGHDELDADAQNVLTPDDLENLKDSLPEAPKGGKIVIDQGMGVTSDGELIQVDEKVEVNIPGSFSEQAGLELEEQSIEYRDGLSDNHTSLKMTGIPKYGNIVMKRSKLDRARVDNTQQLKEIEKLEKEISKHEAELENVNNELEELKDEVEGDENLYEDIEDSQDGSEWGSATYATKLKKEISKKKLRLAELDNLQRYYEVEIKKLKNKIVDINKAIEQSIRENLPPT